MAIDWNDPEEERKPRSEVEALIARMDAFAQDMPLSACLVPYRNYYFPDIAYPAVVLNEFYADTPGQGVGTTYLDELKRLCDDASIILYTDAEGPRSRDYYLRRGFEVTTGRRDHQLVRTPIEPDLDDGPQGPW